MNDGAAWFAALRAAPTTEQFYRDGKHPFGLSSPREMGLLLEKMERGALVDKSSSDLMLQIMRGQVYRTRIPRFVTGYRIPHKTGDFLPFVGDDVGMLEMPGTPGKTIVVSIFTGNHFGSGEALERSMLLMRTLTRVLIPSNWVVSTSIQGSVEWIVPRTSMPCLPVIISASGAEMPG